MMKHILKIKTIFIVSLFFIVLFAMPIFAIWVQNEKGQIFWLNEDGSFPSNGWQMIDEDGDGGGFYYYFDEKGFLLIDDITPDYKIVNSMGMRIGFDGNPEMYTYDPETWHTIELGDEGTGATVYNAEILAEIALEQSTYKSEHGYTSSGQVLYVKTEEEEGPKPSDGLVIETNPDGTAMRILGPNVVLREKKETLYDITIDKKMQSHILSGNKYSKKTNGTTFLKVKWKDCMSLKGNGASIQFENPKNNFNRLKGRIATHYFTYSDRTTTCMLYIYDDETNDLIHTVTGFDYNGGVSFDCTFYRKVNKIRFELDVSGQYTSRVCYLRNCEYSFDREAYEDELYEEEVEQAYIAMYGTESEAMSDEEYEKMVMEGEWSEEGEDPATRYARLHGEQTPTDFSEDDDSISDEMKAKIAEENKKKEAELERLTAEEYAELEKEDEDEEVEETKYKDEMNDEQDKVAGPAFDKKLQEVKENIGPNGMSNIITGKLESSED